MTGLVFCSPSASALLLPLFFYLCSHTGVPRNGRGDPDPHKNGTTLWTPETDGTPTTYPHSIWVSASVTNLLLHRPTSSSTDPPTGPTTPDTGRDGSLIRRKGLGPRRPPL